jgi:hypothetical protein
MIPRQGLSEDVTGMMHAIWNLARQCLKKKLHSVTLGAHHSHLFHLRPFGAFKAAESRFKTLQASTSILFALQDFASRVVPKRVSTFQRASILELPLCSACGLCVAL